MPDQTIIEQVARQWLTNINGRAVPYPPSNERKDTVRQVLEALATLQSSAVLPTQDTGALSGSRADASSPQAVSTKGFDPARRECPSRIDALRNATVALIVAAEKDSVADWPGGVDYSFLDNAWAALDATYPTIWTDEQVAALEAWQDAGWVHPLTCINRGADWHRDEDGDEVTLTVTSAGLVCRCCGYRQFQVPEFCFHGPGSNPASARSSSEPRR